jgi:hypothetical protein
MFRKEAATSAFCPRESDSYDVTRGVSRASRDFVPSPLHRERG